MFRTLIPAIALATTIALPATGALASGYSKPSEEVSQQIRTKLTEQGYDVRKIEIEDGGYEVYALKDGQRLELYLNAAFDITNQKTDN